MTSPERQAKLPNTSFSGTGQKQRWDRRFRLSFFVESAGKTACPTSASSLIGGGWSNKTKWHWAKAQTGRGRSVNHRGKVPSGRGGFSLLEVLVATVVMGIAVTGLIVGLSQSVKNASRLADYDRAAMMARTKMNDLLLDVNLPLQGAVEGSFEQGKAPVPSGWKAVTNPFDLPPNVGPGSMILQQIALQVWWQPITGTRRSLQVDGYRPTRIPFTSGP